MIAVGAGYPARAGPRRCEPCGRDENVPALTAPFRERQAPAWKQATTGFWQANSRKAIDVQGVDCSGLNPASRKCYHCAVHKTAICNK